MVISLDTELEWGFHTFSEEHHLSDDGKRERLNINRLLSLFDQYEAPVTWAIVGHLFLENCDGSHKNIASPAYKCMRDHWWSDDPGGSIESEPLRFGRDIVESILEAEVDHDIGSHTFSHVICNLPGCSASVLQDELEYWNELASEYNIHLSSFVFPQNGINHIKVLSDMGVEIYRGLSPESKYVKSTRTGSYQKYLKFLISSSDPVVEPKRVQGDLWELPASQYLHYSPPAIHPLNSIFWLQYKRAEKAIRQISNNGGIYHIWTHPHNFDDKMFSLLERILEVAEKHDVPVMTMQEVVQQQMSSTR